MSLILFNELLLQYRVNNTNYTNNSYSNSSTKNLCIVRNSLSFDLNNQQCTLLGGALVNWILEQQIERALHFAMHTKNMKIIKNELSNIPHSNWTPSEHIPWLILELEMNIIIRDIQIKVAHHMMQSNITEMDSTTKNIVMQLNMGEGKTSVILPMLAD